HLAENIRKRVRLVVREPTVRLLAERDVVVDVDQTPVEAVAEEPGQEERTVANPAQLFPLQRPLGLERTGQADTERLVHLRRGPRGATRRDEAHQEIDEVVRRPLRGPYLLTLHRALDLLPEELDRRLVAKQTLRHARLRRMHLGPVPLARAAVQQAFLDCTRNWRGIIGTDQPACK